MLDSQYYMYIPKNYAAIYEEDPFRKIKLRYIIELTCTIYMIYISKEQTPATLKSPKLYIFPLSKMCRYTHIRSKQQIDQ